MYELDEKQNAKRHAFRHAASQLFIHIIWMCIFLGLCIIPPGIQLILMPFCPESPRYLLITKEQEEKALNCK